MKGDGVMVMGDGLMLIIENQQSTTHNSSLITIISFSFDHLLISLININLWLIYGNLRLKKKTMFCV